MDKKTIFTKSAKGLREATGKTSLLSRDMRHLLKDIDGKSSVRDLLKKLDDVSEADLKEALEILVSEDFIRELVPDTSATPAPAIAPSRPAPPPPSSANGGEDLDFTALISPASQPDQAAAERVRAEEALRSEREALAKQQAEARAKAETEARAKKGAEERARKEAENKARREAEARATQEAEAKAKAAAAAKAKQEAEAKARREVEARAKAEAEAREKKEAQAKREREENAKREAAERVRKEAEDKARREAEERARQEAETQVRAEAEARAKREADEQARREAEEQLRREAEEQAKREAAEQARKEAEDKARREAEERAKEEAAEAQVRAEAEARAKREAEDRARREAEEQHRREVEEQAKREAAEQTRKEAEDKTRREAEQRAREEAEAHARAEAEARAKREAEEQARREAEERARREAEEHAKREVEEQARREAEKKVEEQARREAEERARQEAEARAEQVAEEQARHLAEDAARRQSEERTRRDQEEDARKRRESAEAKRAAKVERSGNGQSHWGRLLIAAAVALPVLGLALLHVISFDGKIPQLEKAASEQLQQPVKIAALHVSLFPQPHWRLGGVVVGANGQIKAPRIRLAAGLGSVFGGDLVFESLDVDSPVFNDEGLGWLLFGKPQGRAAGPGRISATNAKLDSATISLPAFAVKAETGGDGLWQKIVVESADKTFTVDLTSQSEAVQFETSFSSFAVPFGSGVVLPDFNATGTANRSGVTLNEFKSRLFGGTLTGSVRLKWGGQWSLEGELGARQIDTAQLLPGLLEGDRLDGKARYAMRADEAAKMFAALRLDGNFVIGKGVLLGVDLGRLLQNGETGGKTDFSEISGSFVHERGMTQLPQLRLSAGILSANGSADVDGNRNVRGRLAVDLRMASEQRRASLVVSGTTKAVTWSRR